MHATAKSPPPQNYHYLALCVVYISLWKLESIGNVLSNS
jgi:hypothetical protein